MFNSGHIFKSKTGHEYEVLKSIGKGAYGSVYLVKMNNNHGEE